MLKNLNDTVERGKFSKLYFNCEFCKHRFLRKLLYFKHSCIGKFKTNKMSERIECLESTVAMFDTSLEGMMTFFGYILTEIDENLDLNVKSLKIPTKKHNDKQLPTLVIEFFSLQYKMTLLNDEEKFMRNYKYPKLDFGKKQQAVEVLVIQKYVINSLVTSIHNFLNSLNTLGSALQFIPIILMKSDEQQFRRNSSLIADLSTNEPAVAIRKTFGEVSVQQVLEEAFETQEFLNSLQKSLDESQQQSERNVKFSFLQSLLNNNQDEPKDGEAERCPKLIVCSTLNATMASFLANYSDDSKCKLLVNLSNELKFCYFNEKLKKLIFLNLAKIHELNFSNTSLKKNLKSLWTCYDYELDSLNDAESTHSFDNMTGILNQCELARLVLIDMMIKDVLFTSVHAISVEWSREMYKSKRSSSSSGEYRMKPILLEKIIKKTNVNIKLHMKYSINTKHYADIENDSTCRLLQVKQVLDDLGISDSSFFDRLATKRIFHAITKRSAKLTASLISTLFKHNACSQGDVSIAVDGLMYKSRPVFNAYFEFYLNKLASTELHYSLKLSRLEYLLGASYATMALLEVKLKNTNEHFPEKKTIPESSIFDSLLLNPDQHNMLHDFVNFFKT